MKYLVLTFNLQR